MRRLLLTAALVAAAPLQAQAPALDPARLVPGVDSLAVFFVSGTDTTRTGTLRDEITLVDEGGQRRLRRVYATVDRLLGTRLDTLVDDAATLAPVRHRSRTERGMERIDFVAGVASGWLHLVDGDSVAVRVPVAAGVVNASSFDLALRAAPLAEGWSAEVPAFIPTTRAVTPLRARVAGVETIDGRECWRVDAEFAGTPVTFWIDRRTRALRQQVMRVRADAAILFRAMPPATTPAGRSS